MADEKPAPAQVSPQADGSTLIAQDAPKPVETESILGKSAEQAAVTPAVEQGKPVAVPEKYDLKLKDNSGLDQSHVDALQSFAKERGLSNDQAQSILDRDAERLASFTKSSIETAKAMGQKWVEEVKADAEIGGQHFQKTVEDAVSVINRFGTPELKKVLNSSGLGNHPEVIRMISRIAKTMGNDQLVVSNMDQALPEKKSPAEILYGKK